MKIGLAFWIIYIVWVLFGLYVGSSIAPTERRLYFGGGIVLLALLFLLGWQVFGFALEK